MFWFSLLFSDESSFGCSGRCSATVGKRTLLKTAIVDFPPDYEEYNPPYDGATQKTLKENPAPCKKDLKNKEKNPMTYSQVFSL